MNDVPPKIQSLGPETQPLTSLGPEGDSRQLKKDVKNLQISLEDIERKVSEFPEGGFTEINVALEFITSELKKHAAEAIRLEGQVLKLSSDHETQALAAHLAGIRTRIATLLSQAENSRLLLKETQDQKLKEVVKYQELLDEVEVWVLSLKKTVEDPSSQQVKNFEQLSGDIEEKEVKLRELQVSLQELNRNPDLAPALAPLIEQLRILNLVFIEQKSLITSLLVDLRVRSVQLKEAKTPDLSLENTLDSSSMPIEEVPIASEVKKIADTAFREKGTQPIAHSETQTGRSLSSPVAPIDAQIQAHLSESSEEVQPQKETITISKTTLGGQETIQIATKMEEPQPIIEEPDDDITVEANYRKQPKSDEQTTELSISNVQTNQPFETVFVEPDQTTTEVIVDPDGTKRIIVKKLHRTVVRHQEAVQRQHFTTVSTLTEGDVPVSQSFSQITLHGQQSSTTMAGGDGRSATLTSHQYGSKIVSGAPGGDVQVHEFQSEPEVHFTSTSSTLGPDQFDFNKLHEGDVTLLSGEATKLVPQQGFDGTEIHTSSSSVRAVVQQITRKIIRKTRRIIRKTVIIDGKEHVTEEIVEEPEEIEVTEEGIPRVSINVTRTEDGKVVQEQHIGEASAEVLVDSGKPVESSSVELGAEPELRYVEQTLAQPETSQVTEVVKETAVAEPSSAVDEFIKNERLVASVIESSSVEKAPSIDSAPIKAERKKKKVKKTPDVGSVTVAESIQVAEIKAEDKSPVSSESAPVIQETTTEQNISLSSPHIQEQETLVESQLAEEIAIPSEEKLTPTLSKPVSPITENIENVQDANKISSTKEEVEVPVTPEVCIETKSPPIKEDVEKELLKSEEISSKAIGLITESFLISEQYEKPKEESPKSKKKRRFSKSKKVAGTPRSQSPVEEPEATKPEEVIISETEIATSIMKEPQSGIQIDLSLEETKLVEPSGTEQQVKVVEETLPAQTVNIELSLEEQVNAEETPKVSVAMKVEGNKDKPETAEIVQKDIYVSLPSTKVDVPDSSAQVEAVVDVSPSDDSVHGGRKSKKKKKHKTPTPTPTEIEEVQDSVVSSLAESVDISIPEDSVPSEPTPQSTQEVFEPVTESEEDSSGKGKDTGYEADKTTVDESLADDETMDKKKRKKKKRKQKIKVKENEDSNIPKSLSESSPVGESFIFTDDEPVVAEKEKPEEVKKTKKRKTRGKRKQSGGSEPDEESEAILEAENEEIVSPNDSYHTLSTQSEPGTVKIVEETVLSPTSDSPREISSQIITTVPVLEAVITQEGTIQTSPIQDITTSFIEQEKVPVELDQVSVQTSPEVPKPTSETSIQTLEEVVAKIEKPESTESSTQIILTSSEIETQTTPESDSTEKVQIETVTSEIATSPINTVVLEESVQTSLSTTPDIPRSESAMQTLIETKEADIQTNNKSELVTAETGSQAVPSCSADSVQTSPIPSAPPLEEEVKSPIVTPREVIAAPETPIDFSEAPSSSEYEVLIKTTIRYPSDTSETTETLTTTATAERTEIEEQNVGSQSSDSSDLDVKVNIDAEGIIDSKPKKPRRKKTKKPKAGQEQAGIEKDLFSEFKKQEGSSLDPKDLYSDVAKRGSRSSSPIRPEEPVEAEVFSKVYTDLDEGKVKELASKKKKPKKEKKEKLDADVKISLTIEQPEEVIPEKKVTIVEPSSFTVDSMLTETELTLKSVSPDKEEVKSEPDVLDLVQIEPKVPITKKPIEEFLNMERSSAEEPKPAPKPSQRVKKQKEKSTVKISKEEPHETIDISISVQRGSSPSEVTEIEVSPEEELTAEEKVEALDVADYSVSEPKSKPLTPKTKRKNKHVSSVTIEEIESSAPSPDIPISPAGDYPVSPPSYPTVWQKPQTSTINNQEVTPAILQDVGIRWTHAQALERIKNLQNAKKTTHLSDVLYLATLNEIVTDETVEQKNSNVEKSLQILQEAVEQRNVTVIQHTVITTVETITTWLETIEYRIYVNRQQTADGPSKERVQEFNNLREEIVNIESKVAQLQGLLEGADNIYNEADKERLKEYIESLQQQVRIIEDVTKENEKCATEELKRWEEFINGVSNVNHLVRTLQRQLSDLKESDASPESKLIELEKLDTSNKCQMVKSVHLIATAKILKRDFPNREIPKEVYINHELTKQMEQQIAMERDTSLQFQSLAFEYEQTLKEFTQIILVAEALVESPITVKSLVHLEDEMQNHRKFFVNLSHCRAILESLEENLNSETRSRHADLHRDLYDRATVILDKATGRFQQMSLAATRWTILEIGTKEEMGWLQIAQQRVPDLNSVTSSDYERFIDLYDSLAADIDHHHAKLSHLNSVAQKLQELIDCNDLEEAYTESLSIITKLQEDVQHNLKKLLAFRDSWKRYNCLSDEVECWLKDAENQLSKIDISGRGHMRQFWELKAQHEVYNSARQDATSLLEKALRIVPISDDMIQRKFHSDLQQKWLKVSSEIGRIGSSILETISAPDLPVNEKLALLEQELQDLKAGVDGLPGVIKTEHELNLYVGRLQIMSTRLETIQNELGRLGLLSASESDNVGKLLSLSKRLETVISEELEGGNLLKERLQAIQKGIDRVGKKHGELSQVLDHCGDAEKMGSESVEKAVTECYEVGEELVTLWQDLMGLRQLLHTLPMRLKVTVSPTNIERDISQLQDNHTALEKRCGELLALLRSRLGLWQRFEHQLRLVQQSVQEADFMMELLTVQGTVDYERLRKATERLESVSGELVTRETLIGELKAAAKPLADSCSPEVSAKVEAAVNEAVTAYSTTCNNLKELCVKYQHATDLWKQYKEASDLVREWIENPMESVDNLEPEEAMEQVKVCEETLAAHTKRLAELQNLVSGIASAVGLNANALFNGEVEALSKRLEDVRESLTVLADVVETKAQAKNESKKELVATKTYLNEIQKSLTGLQECETEKENQEKLVTLRTHLLDLSKKEGVIEKIKNNAAETTLISTETSVIEILELWQQVFKETFQQYHRLSTRLVKNEDGAAALKLWQEYLQMVQQFLQGCIPGDFDSLSEHQHLCQIHHNLLTTQQNVLKSLEGKTALASGLVEKSVMEQFNSLTNLHNETLSRIMDRHVEVQKRLNAWNKYRQDQKKLLQWLKSIEKEREGMKLRYMNIRRIPKLLSRIEVLLDKIPQGEEQLRNLEKQQNHLLQFCDEALATSIRIEHVALKQRVDNIQAGLNSWKQFLSRIFNLVKVNEDKVNGVQKLFDEIQEIVNDGTVSVSNTGVSQRVEFLKRTRERLNQAAKSLEDLEKSQEELKESLSPFDVKNLNQKMWLIWHQQGELEHQLTTQINQLEDKLGLRAMFDTRQARFIAWCDELEKKINQDGDENQAEVKDILRKLETDLKAEMALKEREYKWLLKTGGQIVEGCGEEYSDVTAKNIIQTKTDDVRERWERLENLIRSRALKIQQMMDALLTLEQRIMKIRAWLAQMEHQLGKPIIFESSNKEVLDRRMQDHDQLKKEIENESGNIGDMINLCELLSESELWKMQMSENLALAVENLDKRWKAVCAQSEERKRAITFNWKLLQEVLKLSSDQEKWVGEKEQRLKDLDKSVKKLDKDQIQELIYQVENEIKEIESRIPSLQILEQTYSKLATASSLEPENIQELTSRPRVIISRWHNILPKAQSILVRLKEELVPFKDFSLAHEDSVIGLTKIDAQLTELQHLATPEKIPLKERLQKLDAIEKELKNQTPNLENADKLGLHIMQKSNKTEVRKIQEMIDEYQILYKEINERITKLKTELKKQIKKQKPQEVDENIQVETLKFEQDSAVQVNTLPAHLQRMSSISAKDAYLVELNAALAECKSNIDDLGVLVKTEMPKEGSPELPSSSKKIVKTLAACQASIELIKHINNLLITECEATRIEACSEEIEYIITTYETLLVQAKEKEKRLRELSEAGRLLCPLCTKQNWGQLNNDLWRLEKWLDAAEATHKARKSPPSNIEQLEDVIQDHREFSLDLDSHRIIVRSLNIVGTHLADHTEDEAKAKELRTRLEKDNKRWEMVLKNAFNWEIQLQRALMENKQFHSKVSELCVWLEKNEKKIKQSEPLDLTASTDVLEAKYQKFLNLHAEFEKCEPRVLSLQEAANQLLRQDNAPEGSSTICRRLSELRLKLQSLIKLTSIYTLKLGAVLGRDPNELTLALSSSMDTAPSPLSYDLLDRSSGDREASPAPDDSAHNGSGDESEINTTVLRRCNRFLGRVVRMSLPIQALLLVLTFGVLSTYPNDDYSCSLVNTIANSLTPTLRYNDGPPPI